MIGEQFKNEHTNNLNILYSYIEEAKNILDAGSGKSSLQSLINYFPESNIDAVVYSGDMRKIDSIKKDVIGKNYNLIELDLCNDNINNKYDLVLAHLLLGEALTWNNKFNNLVNSLLKIDSKYYIIYDYKEDPNIDYLFLEDQFVKSNLKIIIKKEFSKNIPQEFSDFTGRTYIAYVLQKYI